MTNKKREKYMIRSDIRRLEDQLFEILSGDEEAVNAILYLRNKGYTAEDVANAIARIPRPAPPLVIDV